MARETLFTRNFVLLWQGQLVSQLGNQAFLVATTWFTLDGTGSASLVALVMIASTLPAVIVGPFGGAVADRHSRRTILVVTDLLRAAAVGGFALVLAVAPEAAAPQLALLVAVATFNGVMGAFFTPAVQAVLPDLVPGARLASANAVMQMSSQSCMLIGQALGGLLYVTWGAAALLLLDAFSFAYGGLSAWLITAGTMHARRRDSVRQAVVRYATDVREGLSYVRQRAGMAPLLGTFAGINLSFMPVFVLLPLYVREVLDRGPEWYGFLLAASGAGALTGSALAGLTLGKAAAIPSILTRSLAGVAAGVLALAATRQAYLAMAAFIVIGALSSLINVAVITAFQSATPPAIRGRVMAVVIAVSTAVVPLGLGAGGLMGDLWRSFIPIVFGGCGTAIAVLAGVGYWTSSFVDLHETAEGGAA